MANYPVMNYQQPMYSAVMPWQQQTQPVPQWIQQNTVPQAVPQIAVQAPQPQSVPAQQAASQPGFSGRYVTSKEEVVAAQIPFDGSACYFVNTSNGEIYSKAYDFSTGSAPVKTYVMQAPQQVQEQPAAPVVNIPDYSPMFHAVGEQLSQMAGRIDELFEKIETAAKPTPKTQPKGSGKGNEA